MYKIFGLFVIAYFLSSPLQADDITLQEQIDEVNAMIEEEKEIKAELRAQLAARETEVTELKLRLRELEEKIAELKLEHNLEN